MISIRPPPEQIVMITSLYYTILYTMKRFCFRNNTERIRNPLFLTFHPMETPENLSFDFIKNPNRFESTINLAEIVGAPAAKKISHTIRVEIESDETEFESIPVRVLREISVSQLNEIVKSKVATKVEFRLFNAMRRMINRKTVNFNS